MNTYLKPFELTLRCLGPVFIGSGEKRTSKEYHVEGDRVYFPDMELLYADIPAHKRKSFEAFVMNTDGAQATAPLKEWVEPNAVKLDPAKHRGYEVKIGSIEPRRASRGRGGRMTRKKLTLNEIHAFIKDPLGRPYVPGSTVKECFAASTCSRLCISGRPNLFVFRDTRRGSTGSTAKGLSGRSCANRGALTPVRKTRSTTCFRRSGSPTHLH